MGVLAAATRADRHTRVNERTAAVAIALIVALALAVRIPGFDQSLYGDELFTYDRVVDRSFGSMWDFVREGEDSPPVFFVVAWLAAKLGEPTVLIRIPSLLAACATVPLVYGVGARSVGPSAGMVGALLFAVAPFAVFYGAEARPYSLMGALVTLAAYGTLRTRDEDGTRWWALVAVAAALAVFAHYTAVWVLIALCAWVLVTRPEARRPAAVAFGAPAVAALAWQLTGPEREVEGFAALYPFDADHAVKALARAAVGHPFAPLRDVPGTAGVVLLAAAVATAALALWRSERRRVGSGEVLVAALGLATPVGCALYSAVATSIFAPRNLYASLPFACLTAGAVLARGRRPWSVLATALAVAGLLAATVSAYGPDSRRPPFNEAAEWLGPRPGPVIVLNPIPAADQYRAGAHPLLTSVTAYIDDPARVREVGTPQLEEFVHRARPRVLHVIVPIISGPTTARPAIGPPYRVTDQRTFRAFAPVVVYTYER